MKNRLQGILIGLILGVLLTSFVFAEPIAKAIEVVFDNYRLVIDGKDVSDYPDDMKPLNYNGRVYLPLRYVGDVLNMDVSWRADSKTITLNTKTDAEFYIAPANPLSDADMAVAMYILRSRLLGMGVNSLQTELMDGKIKVMAQSKELNAEKLQSVLGKGELTLSDADGMVILDSSHITAAFPCYDDLTKTGFTQHYIEICLTDEGRAQLAQETARIAGYADGKNYIAICMDGKVLSAPFVQGQIDSARIIITGNFTQENTSAMAAILSASPLNTEFNIIK